MTIFVITPKICDTPPLGLLGGVASFPTRNMFLFISFGRHMRDAQLTLGRMEEDSSWVC